jgi:hypothetical protein
MLVESYLFQFDFQKGMVWISKFDLRLAADLRRIQTAMGSGM